MLHLSYEEENDRIYNISFHEAKVLTLLAHEFGHLKYIVPNISDYHEFYVENYSLNNGSQLIGHSLMTPVVTMLEILKEDSNIPKINIEKD